MRLRESVLTLERNALCFGHPVYALWILCSIRLMDSRRFQRHYKSELNTLIISVRGRRQREEGAAGRAEGRLGGSQTAAELSTSLINVS